MEGKLWLMLMVVTWIGCCYASQDCHGNEYEEGVDLDELKRILIDEKEAVSRDLGDDKNVAALLAQAKDKHRTDFIDGISVEQLLEFATAVDDQLREKFCSAEEFRKLKMNCGKVRRNRYLANYCTKGIKRIRAECIGSDDWLYKRIIVNNNGQSSYSHVKMLAESLLEYAKEKGKLMLTPAELVSDYKSQRGELFGNIEEYCKNYVGKLKDLFFIDTMGEKTYEYFQKTKDYVNYYAKDYCNFILAEYFLHQT